MSVALVLLGWVVCFPFFSLFGTDLARCSWKISRFPDADHPPWRLACETSLMRVTPFSPSILIKPKAFLPFSSFSLTTHHIKLQLVYFFTSLSSNHPFQITSTTFQHNTHQTTMDVSNPHREGLTTLHHDWTMIPAGKLIERQTPVTMYVNTPKGVHILGRTGTRSESSSLFIANALFSHGWIPFASLL